MQLLFVLGGKFLKGFREAASASKKRAILGIIEASLTAELTKYKDDNQCLLTAYCALDTRPICLLSQSTQHYLLCTIIIPILHRKQI